MNAKVTTCHRLIETNGCKSMCHRRLAHVICRFWMIYVIYVPSNNISWCHTSIGRINYRGWIEYVDFSSTMFIRAWPCRRWSVLARSSSTPCTECWVHGLSRVWMIDGIGHYLAIDRYKVQLAWHVTAFSFVSMINRWHVNPATYYSLPCPIIYRLVQWHGLQNIALTIYF